ncbi:ribbon-helix-helix domain-containing protein [Nocardiopsis chromatogenes]|uniref:ribbon-helix-helix domain-containing protein n=1 Tax=Nocardiopsis chromatogenes TaxID=280239 RepID=UPI00034A1A58|nr:ribbon-helix-helix domain-containing protein [Nocardiopsis chromatogenes]
MSEVKKRVTVTLDPELLAWAEQLVEAGEARSVSAVVNEALADKVRRQENASILIEQDMHEARRRDPEEFERAMEWALGITGGPLPELPGDGATDGEAAA